MIHFESTMLIVFIQSLFLNVEGVFFVLGIFALIYGLISICFSRREFRRYVQAQKSVCKMVVLTEENKNLNNHEQRCAACFEDFRIKDELAILPCQHSFHKRCLLKWLDKRGMCPICYNLIIAANRNLCNILDEEV